MKQLKLWNYLLVIFAVAVVLRLVVAVYLGDTVLPNKDEYSYSELATRVANGYGFSFPENWYPFTPAEVPTSHWSFLYTGFVAAVYMLFGPHPLAVRLISAVSGGILLPWMAFRLARTVFPERQRLALVVAGLTAVYAYFILFSAQLMTETFYIATLLWSLERAFTFADALRSGKRPLPGLIVSFGISLGMATLLRQSILPWVALLLLWLLWQGLRQKKFKITLISLMGSGLIVLLCILPFTIRNYRVYGDFMLLNSNAGFAMYSAQHPMHGTSFQAFTAAPLPADVTPKPQNEAQWDRVLMQRGFQFILDEPGRYALLSLSRAVDYFMFWPSSETTLLHNLGRVLAFGFFLPFIIYGLWLSRRMWQRLTLLYLFIGFYTGLHLLTWSMVRYRLPVDAVLLLFAGLALIDLAQRFMLENGRFRLHPLQIKSSINN